MITVGIYINGGLLVGKNAINTGKVNKKGESKYITDGGHVVWHKREDGAVSLSKKILDTIKNDGGKR